MNKDFVNAIEKEYTGTSDSAVTKTIDKFQLEFKCCGYNNYTNWKDSKYFADKGTIPKSCCKDQNNAQCPTILNPTFFNTKVIKLTEKKYVSSVLVVFKIFLEHIVALVNLTIFN